MEPESNITIISCDYFVEFEDDASQPISDEPLVVLIPPIPCATAIPNNSAGVPGSAASLEQKLKS